MGACCTSTKSKDTDKDDRRSQMKTRKSLNSRQWLHHVNNESLAFATEAAYEQFRNLVPGSNVVDNLETKLKYIKTLGTGATCRVVLASMKHAHRKELQLELHINLGDSDSERESDYDTENKNMDNYRRPMSPSGDNNGNDNDNDTSRTSISVSSRLGTPQPTTPPPELNVLGSLNLNIDDFEIKEDGDGDGDDNKNNNNNGGNDKNTNTNTNKSNVEKDKKEKTSKAKAGKINDDVIVLNKQGKHRQVDSKSAISNSGDVSQADFEAEIEDNNSKNSKSLVLDNKNSLSVDHARHHSRGGSRSVSLQDGNSNRNSDKNNNGRIDRSPSVSFSIPSRSRAGTVDFSKYENKLFALKQMRKDDKDNVGSFEREATILTKLKHKNIVKLITCYIDSYNFYIATKFCTGGPLLDFIIKCEYFGEAMASYYIKTILGAINYCHKQNIVHRDLKPGNIMFDKVPILSNELLNQFKKHKIHNEKKRKQEDHRSFKFFANKAKLVIIDFGEAIEVDENKIYDECVGTMLCMLSSIKKKPKTKKKKKDKK